MYVPEIIEVKDCLKRLKAESLVETWELPYENLLTRRSAAIFFLAPTADRQEVTDKIWKELSRYSYFKYQPNEEKKLSKLAYRITFNESTN